MGNARSVVPDHVIEESVGEEIVLLSLKKETFYSLNRTGAFLWQHLKEGCAPQSLVANLCETFGISAEQAEQDVAAFLAALRAKDLIA